MKSFNEWVSEGETIYSDALKEYQAIESQIAQLESQREAKKAQVNQIAQIIGKPPVVNAIRLTTEFVENDVPLTRKIGSSPRALINRGIWAR